MITVLYTFVERSAFRGKKPKIVETRQFKNFNTGNFQQDLRQAFGSVHLYNCTDPDGAWHTWKMLFLGVADHHAPLKIRKVKSEYNPWMTNEIKSPQLS